MNRRDALQQIGVLALLASPVGLALGQRPAHGQPQGNFQVLPSKIATDTPDKIEVLEFFHYTCSHCHEFEPLIAQWSGRLPNDVAFKRIPVIWGKQHKDFARLYFTLLVTKRLDLHETVFTAVQKKQLRLENPNAVRNWVKTNKLDESTFMNIYDSFGVNTQIERAEKLTASYRIESVPTIAVNGRFLTSASMAGSHEATLKVVDNLIERVRKGE